MSIIWPIHWDSFRVAQASAVRIILLWIFNITLIGSVQEGTHLEISFGFLWFEISVTLSLWNRLVGIQKREEQS